MSDPRNSPLDKIRRGLARRLPVRRLAERRAVGMLSICFDDFPRSAWTAGGEVLRDHGVRATYFVAGGLCDSEFAGHRMFTREDLEAIHAEGNEIGCHTFHHTSCLRSSRAQLGQTLSANASFVRDVLGDVRMVSFTYPYGDAPLYAKRVAAFRFAAARGVDAGLNRGWLDLTQLKSVGLEKVYRDVEGVKPWIERAAASSSWLIVHTHDVSDDPGPFGCRPGDLDGLVRAAKAAGLEILTLKGALGGRTFAAPQ